MKKALMGFVASVFALAVLTGCNTVQGVGQDVQAGGKAIEKAAK